MDAGATRRVLAVVGSRRFRNRQWLELASARILHAFDALEPDLVVSGGAEGVDQLGAALARARRIDVDEKLPVSFCTAEFKARDLLIAEACTHLLAVRCAASTTYGSGWTADRAEEMGRAVARYIIPATR